MSRIHKDAVAYICGDHNKPEQFEAAERVMSTRYDYTVISSFKLAENGATLLERLELLDRAQEVFYVGDPMDDTEAMAEVAYAIAKGFEPIPVSMAAAIAIFQHFGVDFGEQDCE